MNVNDTVVPPAVPEQVLLVLNCGSSSLKFSVHTADASLQTVFRGELSGITGQGLFQVEDEEGRSLHSETVDTGDHEQAVRLLFDWLSREAVSLELVAAGHRVVHGGRRFYEAVCIADDVIDYLESLTPLAPNHQPPSLLGIATLQELHPDLMQVACFDTAFHHQRPEVEQRFALPQLPELDVVRRYGFHGLSYQYIASVLPDQPGLAASGRVIIAHLGHGASLCALRERRSVATTMTFTPLDGIPMGTRCGSIDPGVVLYLQQQGMTPEQVSDLLYFQSGLLGVSGSSDDMDVLLQQTDERSRFAVEQFIHYTVRAIGSLAAALGGLDALVFSGGIGEHAVTVREDICVRCQWLGLDLDKDANRLGRARISLDESPVQAWTIPTNEERIIAEQTYHLMKARTQGISA